MNSAWGTRKRTGEGDAPVELRFVDMFMAAIGALIFLAMTLAILMQQLTRAESTNQLRVLVALEAPNIDSETTDALRSRTFSFKLFLTNAVTAFGATFDSKDPPGNVLTNLPPPVIYLYNYKFDVDVPFVELLINDPPKGSYQLQVNVESRGGGINSDKTNALRLRIRPMLANNRVETDLQGALQITNSFTNWSVISRESKPIATQFELK